MSEGDARVVLGRKPEAYDPFPRRIAQDEGLTPEALGLLCYLYSLPHDWDIYTSQIEKWSGWGRDKRQSVMKMCIEQGYLELIRGGEGSGSFYRMTDKLALHMDDAPDTDNRKSRQSDGGDYRKNRLPEKPTTGKSGPIHKDTPSTEQTLKTHNVGSSISLPVDWSFLNDDANLVPRIRELVFTYCDQYENMWMDVIKEDVSEAKLALLFSSCGVVKFACVVAITEKKSSIAGRRLAFATAVARSMGDIKSPAGPRKPIPGWIPRTLQETGLVSASAMAICVSSLQLDESNFIKAGVDTVGDELYKPDETAESLILQ